MKFKFSGSENPNQSASNWTRIVHQLKVTRDSEQNRQICNVLKNFVVFGLENIVFDLKDRRFRVYLDDVNVDYQLLKGDSNIIY